MRVACIQMCSGSSREANLATAECLLTEAASNGAKLALLPENFSLMGLADTEKLKMAEDQAQSPTLAFLSDQAKQHHMTIVGGTLLLKDAAGLMRNACPVFDGNGQLLAIYDKIHLFDMNYQGERYHESALIKAGDNLQAIDVGGFKAGLSTCYDLRFPELYRTYVDQGCDLLCNVAAFTAATGRAHWQILLRARAIENQCFMLASAQTGMHPDGRETWGHSMIIDPWGEVLTELAEGEGVIVADLSRKRLHEVRSSFPALQHRKL